MPDRDRDADPDGFDAVLLLSFGGPEGPDEVVPFLQNVTRGRNIPEERLKEVGEHYFHFGGVSPINAINRDLQQRMQRVLADRAIDLPVYWGNRNWHPMVEPVVRQMVDDGVRSALVMPTSAYGGYSACRQYHEDISRARAAIGDDAPVLEKLPQTYCNETFVQINAAAVRRARQHLGREAFDATTRLVFTAHSVPTKADEESGPDGHLYSQQLAAVARRVADEVGAPDFDLVWQSRSGPPQVPWLEPDICDHLESLVGVEAVVLSPIGFVSDHLEIKWDLDTEARGVAERLGMKFARAASASDSEDFVQMYADLIARRLGREHRVIEWIDPLQGVQGLGVNGTPCAPHCCGA